MYRAVFISLVAGRSKYLRWVSSLLLMALLSIFMLPIDSSMPVLETEEASSIKDRTSREFETSEYLIGGVPLGVIFESNRKIDPYAENWTSEEEAETLAKTQHAFDR